MTITRTDHNQRWDKGVLVADVPVVVDITGDVVTLDLHGKARAALTANATFQALPSPTPAQVLAQTKLLTREVNALIRLLVGADLLDDTATDT